MDDNADSVEFIDSDEEHGSLKMGEVEDDPDFDANRLTWAPHTKGIKQLTLKKNENLWIPVPGNRSIECFSSSLIWYI